MPEGYQQVGEFKVRLLRPYERTAVDFLGGRSWCVTRMDSDVVLAKFQDSVYAAAHARELNLGREPKLNTLLEDYRDTAKGVAWFVGAKSMGCLLLPLVGTVLILAPIGLLYVILRTRYGWIAVPVLLAALVWRFRRRS